MPEVEESLICVDCGSNQSIFYTNYREKLGKTNVYEYINLS